VSTPASRRWRRTRRRFVAALGDRQWALPLVGAIVGTILGLALFNVDEDPGDWTITVSQSRATLTALVALMFSILSVSLSLTTLTLDNVTSHFSIRMLTVVVNDYRTKVATSMFTVAVSFIGVELYKLTEFSSDELTPRVPFGVAIALIVCSGVALFWQLNYTIQSLRLDRSLSRLKRKIRRTADADERRFRGWEPASRPAMPDGCVPLLAADSGYIVGLDLDDVLNNAETAGAHVVISREVGDPVVAGDEIGWIGGDDELVIPSRVVEDLRLAVEIGPDRSIREDVGFGIRILVDIASLALSPAVNDPYTAVQVVDKLAIVFADLAPRRLGPRAATADGGVVAWVAVPTLDDHLTLATEQISRYGATEPTVTAALVRLCDTAERCSTSDVERTAVRRRRRSVLPETIPKADDQSRES